MKITLLLWIVVGAITGFVVFGPPGALTGIIAGVLIRISDQLSIIADHYQQEK